RARDARRSDDHAGAQAQGRSGGAAGGRLALDRAAHEWRERAARRPPQAAGRARMNPPRVVIVGGGFAGLAAAKALGKAEARVVLIDRANHHLFQPLLYQVATAALAPGQIAVPIRSVLRKQRNATVILGEVTDVDASGRQVLVDTVDRRSVAVAYDYLILATGVRHSYFGHDEFEAFAPGLKSLADAVGLRNRILRAFERAETEEDP